MRPSTASGAQVAFRAHGSVQGVGYRRFVAQLAQTLGLAGWVRNDPDGSVHGAAEGPEAVLDVFRARLAQGSPYAQVTRLDWTPLDVRSSLPHPFDIRR